MTIGDLAACVLFSAWLPPRHYNDDLMTAAVMMKIIIRTGLNEVSEIFSDHNAESIEYFISLSAAF